MVSFRKKSLQPNIVGWVVCVFCSGFMVVFASFGSSAPLRLFFHQDIPKLTTAPPPPPVMSEEDATKAMMKSE